MRGLPRLAAPFEVAIRPLHVNPSIVTLHHRGHTCDCMSVLFAVLCVPCDPFQSSESPGMAIVSALNARFRAGTVSDDPASAGVVLHGLNPQLGKGPAPWLSSERAARVSCVIANARLPFIFHGWRRNPNQRSPGFVLRPSVVKRALLCAYGHDGSTDGMNCPAVDWRASPNKCTPGCPSHRPIQGGTVRSWD